MSTFCGECGKEIADGAKFCPACGAAVKVDSSKKDAPETAANSTIEASRAEPRKPASEGKRFLNFIIDLISLYIFGYLIGSFFNGIGSGDGFQNFITNDPYVFNIVAGTIFYVFFETLWQRTPGKFLTGTKVVNKNGDAPAFGNILGRSLARYIPFEPFSFFGNNPTGWHDTLSGTFVVPVDYTPADVRAIKIEKSPKKKK